MAAEIKIKSVPANSPNGKYSLPQQPSIDQIWKIELKKMPYKYIIFAKLINHLSVKSLCSNFPIPVILLNLFDRSLDSPKINIAGMVHTSE
jgi:hypothetical protein